MREKRIRHFLWILIKSFSKEFCFQIAETLDESVDHKIMAAMTVYPDKHVKIQNLNILRMDIL